MNEQDLNPQMIAATDEDIAFYHAQTGDLTGRWTATGNPFSPGLYWEDVQTYPWTAQAEDIINYVTPQQISTITNYTPDMNNTHEYILRSGRFFRRDYRDTDLGAQAEMLQQLSENLEPSIQKLAMVNIPLPATTKNPESRRDFTISGSFGNTTYTLSTKLPFFPIYAPFREVTYDTGTEVFDQEIVTFSPDNESTLKRMEWTDKNTDLYMICTFDQELDSLIKVYLIGVNHETIHNTPTTKVFVPMFPNVHDDGEICMGNSFRDELAESGANTAVARFAYVLEDFFKTTNNRDLDFDSEMCRFMDNKFFNSRVGIDESEETQAYHRSRAYGYQNSVTREYLVKHYENVIKERYSA